MCATFSPGIVRNWSPAASSEPSISASAVESHASSALFERFLNPSTATVRRDFAASAGAFTASAGPEATCAADCSECRLRRNS
jgi:hypothetical protein